MKSYPRTIILTFLLVCFFSSQSFAKKNEVQKAPSFDRKGIWLNVPKKFDFSHKAKVRLIYFWDYTSVNCLREIALLKKWSELYQPFGLQIFWMHAPEFQFARNKKYVQIAVKKFNIKNPVFLDNEFKYWEKFGNRSWPAKYLINEKGEIAFSLVGEGRYGEMENHIRLALMHLDPRVILPEPTGQRDIDAFDSANCGLMSGETYLGYKRSTWLGGKLANTQYLEPKETTMFKDRGERVEHGFFTHGLWTNREDDFQHARSTEELKDYVGLLYVAREVYVVANALDYEGEEAARIYFTRDEEPLPEMQRGLDIQVDESGGTYIQITEPRLYRIIRNETFEVHELRAWTQDKGVGINSFSFANLCLSDIQEF